MKRYLYALALLCVLPRISYGQDFVRQVNTVAGALRIADANAQGICVVYLNGRAIANAECEYSYTPTIIKHIRGDFGPFEEVLVLQELPMGNACNGGPLNFIGISRRGPHVLSDEVDFCGGADPIVAQAGGQVFLILPGGPPNRGTGHIPTEVWMFEEGRLTYLR